MKGEHSYVYFLVHSKEAMFKNGKADNVLNRIYRLEEVWGKFDLKKSYIAKCDKSLVLNLERMLHIYFDNYKVHNLHNKDGYNEFYHVDCLYDMLDFVNTFSVRENKNITILNLHEAIYKNQIEELTLKLGSKKARVLESTLDLKREMRDLDSVTEYMLRIIEDKIIEKKLGVNTMDHFVKILSDKFKEIGIYKDIEKVFEKQ